MGYKPLIKTMSGIKLNTPRLPYTGEGFRGEQFLAITAVGLTIVSSILLIRLSILQREQIKMEMAEAALKKKEDEEKKNNQSKK
jgi:hypothetical protein